MDCAVPLLEVVPMQTAAATPRKKVRREWKCIGDKLAESRTADLRFYEQESKHHKRPSAFFAGLRLLRSAVVVLADAGDTIEIK